MGVVVGTSTPKAFGDFVGALVTFAVNVVVTDVVT